MLVAVAPLLGFVLGVGFAWAAGHEQRAAGAAPDLRALSLVALFGLLVHGPLVAYFVAYHPDWSYAFVINTARLPGVVDSAAVLAAIAAPPLGFVVAARRAAERRLGPLLQIAAAPAVLAGAIFAVSMPRLAVQATYTQYHGDFGVQPIAGSQLGYSVAFMSAILVGAVVWTAMSLHRFRGQQRQP